MTAPVATTATATVRRRAAVAAMVFGAAACSDDEPTTVAAGPGEAGDVTTTTGPEDPSTLLARCQSLEPEPVVDGPLSGDPEVAAAQRWRATMGLRSDEAWAAAVPTMPTTAPEAGSFEHPLTDDEVATILSRGPSDEIATATLAYSGRYADTYGGRWIDNAAGGQFTMAFTAEIDARQAELDAELGVGQVQVVEVANTEAELAALASEIAAFLQDREIAYGGVGSGSTLNVVSVDLGVLDDASVRPLLDRFGSDRLCVTGADPADVIPAGPQPEGGDGWRLLADEPGVGDVYRTAVATDQASYDALWSEIGLAGEPPPVDLDAEVVVWFAPAVSGSCREIRLDDVVVDDEAGLVYPAIVLPGGNRTCTSDANPHAYVVALDREALPGEFTVQLGPEVICTGCEEAGESETTPVTLDG